jgi:hypothetical protein
VKPTQFENLPAVRPVFDPNGEVAWYEIEGMKSWHATASPGALRCFANCSTLTNSMRIRAAAVLAYRKSRMTLWRRIQFWRSSGAHGVDGRGCIRCEPAVAGVSREATP